MPTELGERLGLLFGLGLQQPLLLAFWAILTGILELAAAFRLEFIDGRGWLIFGGIVSVLYGSLLIVAPMIGAVVLTWWLGAYALIFGVSLVVLAFKLRSRLDKQNVSRP